MHGPPPRPELSEVVHLQLLLRQALEGHQQVVQALGVEDAWGTVAGCVDDPAPVRAATPRCRSALPGGSARSSRSVQARQEPSSRNASRARRRMSAKVWSVCGGWGT